jgi:hypothetical protein
MSVEEWLARLAVAIIVATVVGVVSWWVITPRMTIRGYRRALPSNRFDLTDAGIGAGSSDLAYYNMAYDVRHGDLEIAGLAPSAAHWQFGAFDGHLRLVAGGYQNNHSIPVDADGRFQLLVTADPAAGAAPGALDCSTCPQGMIIYRLLLPVGPIDPPTVTRLPR